MSLYLKMINKLNLDLADNIAELRYLLKHFEVRTKRYRIFFRGKSFEFDGFRTFSPDDDLNSVDWKASAKANQLLVRQYREEEDKKIIFVLDIRENMVSGSAKKLKCEYAAEIVLSLVDLIVNFNDRVGLVLYNDKVGAYFPPKRGKKTFDIYLDFLSNPEIYKGKSNLVIPLEFILQSFDMSVSAVIIVSDFLSFNKPIKQNLQLIASKYETIAFMVRDNMDSTLPNISRELILEDPRTGEQIMVDPKVARTMYEKHALEQKNHVIESFKDAGIDFIEFETSKPFVHDLINFLEERVKRR